MENIESILTEWEKDSVIDRTEPGKELLNIPKLHSKYLGALVKHRIAKHKRMSEYNRIKRVKYEYYSGKMDEEQLKEYGWEPFRYVLKSDITNYIEADADLIKILEKKAYHEEVISVCEAIMKELGQRTWQLKEYCGWEKFIAGN
jgi:uncharacterized protein YlaI